MTNYELISSMSLEELARWIDENGQFDDSPWMSWFDEKYCSKCKGIKIKREDSLDKLGFKLKFVNGTTCSYCEIYKQCKFFPGIEEIPSNVDIIEMWLKELINE